jgi:hypothetical protein
MKYQDADRDAKAKRARALARPELGAVQYVRVEDRLPESTRTCWAWADADDGAPVYRLPFAVFCLDGIWFNAARQSRLTIRVIGWNYTSPSPTAAKETP